MTTRSDAPLSSEKKLRGKRAIISSARFVQWLESLPPSHKFNKGAGDCALAQYSGYLVGWNSYCRAGGSALPAWAVWFLEHFMLGKPGPFTARKALLVMRRFA